MADFGFWILDTNGQIFHFLVIMLFQLWVECQLVTLFLNRISLGNRILIDIWDAAGFLYCKGKQFFCNNNCCRDANVWRSQIWNFFRSSTPRPNSPMRPPQKKFLIYFYSLPPPPPPISPRNFAGKTWISLCQGLQVVEYSSYQTLDYIGVTKKKVSFFCLQRATCMTQENEARNRNTSIRSQMISEFILEYMEFKSQFFVGN